MKKFILKLVQLFVILFIISSIYFVLDNKFSPYFRHHEKLRSYTNSNNFYLENYEQTLSVNGDLIEILNFEPNFFHKVFWKTDNYGFRNFKFHTDPDVIVLGDSHFLGFGTTQDLIFSELLQKDLNLKVLNLAGAHPYLLFNLISNNIIKKPKLVILGRGERAMDDVLGNNLSSKKLDKNIIKNLPFLNKLYQSVNKKYLFKSLIKDFKSSKKTYDNSMLFLDDDFKDKRSKINNKSIKELSIFKYKLDSLNIDFLFIPIPSKKTIFPHLSNNKNDIKYIKNVYKNLDSLNFDYINLLNAFNDKSDRMYHLDDTHINKLGHKIIQTKTSSFILSK